jgi:hypothetical protein
LLPAREVFVPGSDSTCTILAEYLAQPLPLKTEKKPLATNKVFCFESAFIGVHLRLAFFYKLHGRGSEVFTQESIRTLQFPGFASNQGVSESLVLLLHLLLHHLLQQLSQLLKLLGRQTLLLLLVLRRLLVVMMFVLALDALTLLIAHDARKDLRNDALRLVLGCAQSHQAALHALHALRHHSNAADVPGFKGSGAACQFHATLQYAGQAA